MRDLNHAVSSCNFNLIIFSMTSQLPINHVTITHHPSLVLFDFGLVLAGSGFGAILPDIDHEYSNIHFYMQPFSKIFKKHRAITHSLAALIAIIVINLIFAKLWPALSLLFCSISLGYFWHLLEDSRSKAGIMWLYPLTHYVKGKGQNVYYKPRKNWNFTYKSSGSFEYAFAWINMLIFILLLLHFVNLFYWKTGKHKLSKSTLRL